MNEMNKSSSHGNGLASSSDDDVSEGRTEQRAIALLPKAYPFELTDEFRAAFSQEGEAALPSSFNYAYWKKHVGDAAWEKEVAETEQANQKLIAHHKITVATIAEENRQIGDANRLAAKEFEEALRVYSRDMQNLPGKRADLKNAREEQALALRREELHNAIKAQEQYVKHALEDAWRIAEIEFSRTSLLARLLKPSLRRSILARTLTYYSTLTTPDKELQPKYHFFLSSVSFLDHEGQKIYSPVDTKHTLELLRENCLWYLMSRHSVDEQQPFGHFEAHDFKGYRSLRHAFEQKASLSDVQRYRRERLTELLRQNADNGMGRGILVEQYARACPQRMLPEEVREPSCPLPPVLHEYKPTPSSPLLFTPKEPKPPEDCLDTIEEGYVEHVFKGSQVYGIEQVTTLARSRLFANDEVRPHFTYGGVPIPIVGNSPHMMIIGTTGSGKTTTLLRLMSSLLPLSTAQATRLASRLSSEGKVYPESLHQWGRSRTHQAVVYNAKGEYLQYLKAFGFDSEVDLFNLDPADPNGYAWDVAADVDTRESIKKFSEQLIPKSVKESQDKQTEFWNGTARKIVEAIIISLRNAARLAGKKPSWTLRDLVKIASDEDYIKELLLWHDTPLETFNRFFRRHGLQTSSVMLTLTECMGEYDLVAEQWYHAKKRGRAISLKKWSLEGGQSVVVLPDTMKNVSTYAPLNKAVVKALAGIWLNEKYSLYVDADGREQKRHRFFIVDEFGEAGQFDELQRILAQGRTFGIHVVLGVHQLSQVEETYGEKGAKTIFGLCPYKACLKSNDIDTQEWMSKIVGNCLRSYDKKTFSYSTANGVTLTDTITDARGGSEGTSESESNAKTKGASDTTTSSQAHTDSKQKSSTSSPKPGDGGTSTSGTGESDTQTTGKSHTDNESETKTGTSGKNTQTNWNTSIGNAKAVNESETKGESKTFELRGEAAIEPYEFERFADPETTGECEGVYISPTLPVFRTKLKMAQVQPEYEFPEQVGKKTLTRSPEEDELVSKPTDWTSEDLERLFLDKPHTLPQMTHRQTLLDKPAVIKQGPSKTDEQLLLEEQHDPEPPTPNFDFD